MEQPPGKANYFIGADRAMAHKYRNLRQSQVRSRLSWRRRSHQPDGWPYDATLSSLGGWEIARWALAVAFVLAMGSVSTVYRRQLRNEKTPRQLKITVLYKQNQTYSGIISRVM